jgi:hypothetical protein
VIDHQVRGYLRWPLRRGDPGGRPICASSPAVTAPGR